MFGTRIIGRFVGDWLRVPATRSDDPFVVGAEDRFFLAIKEDPVGVRGIDVPDTPDPMSYGGGSTSEGSKVSAV